MAAGKRIVTMILALALMMQPAAIGAADTASTADTQTQTTQPVDNNITDTTLTTDSTSVSDSQTISDPQPAASTQTGPQTPTGPPAPVGPQEPTGPQADSGPSIPQYAFNDATSTWVSTDQGSFHWDASLGRYVSPLYSYASNGWYHVIPQPVVVAPLPNHASSGPGGVSAGAPMLAANDPALGVLAQLFGSAATDGNAATGPNSTNAVDLTGSSSALLQNLASALMRNADTSHATTGDATVSNNTLGGDATSGAALVVQNLINLMNAAWGWSNGGLTYIMQNLFGDHTGDITFNPTAADGGGGRLGSYLSGSGVSGNSTTGPNSTNTVSQVGGNNLTVVNGTSGAITNDINLAAASGNATVNGNTTGGNATSGDAAVDLNILNLINSAINAGQSFFGLLNIFGNLNGDILFPDGFLDGATGSSQMVGPVMTTASTGATGPGSTNQASAITTNNATITTNAAAAFNNNIDTSASSGNAYVANNTAAGSATSGDASTNDSLFNLFNTNVLGDNAVLVLVNVMGHWFGHIMTLPDGTDSTGALLTGNATVSNTGTGPNSDNTASSQQSNSATLNNSATGTITNNIYATAASGDATVSNNTQGGNATSGAAHVATNVANIFNSAINVKKWFGILVINVFGDWTGSVGDDTAAGSVPMVTVVGISHPEVAAATGQAGGRASDRLFIPVVVATNLSNADTQGATVTALAGDGGMAGPNGPSHSSATLVAAAHTPSRAAVDAAKTSGLLVLLAAASLLLAGGALGLERKLKR